MSQIRSALSRIKEAAFNSGGLAKLADLADVPRSSARELVKEDHAAVGRLLKLEAAAERVLTENGPAR